ncbi:hypothetical protein [Nocardioides ferulae]|nr:hypothetical protein [Nocardioides ferulae]
MIFVFLLLAIAAFLAAAGVHLSIHDGRGPAGPPASHEDPTFRSPSAW